MITDEKYKLACRAVELASKYGATEVSVSVSESKNSNVDVRDQKIDTLTEAIESSLSIRLFVDNRYSSHSTNRLNKKELEHFIKEAVAATRYLSEDPLRSLPSPGLYYKGDGQGLKVQDGAYDKVEADEKIKLAFEIEKEAFGKDEKIISVTTSYDDYTGDRLLINSNGFEGRSGSSYFGLAASVSVNGGDSRPVDYWRESSVFYDRLKKSDIASVALSRVLKKIGSEKIKSDKYDMIVENRVASRLLGPLVQALYGYSLQQKDSFLIGMKDREVGSEMLDLIDDPLIVDARASRFFDGEGLASVKRTVFEKGVLRTYFIDTYYGRKLEMEPTTGATSNIILTPGTQSLEQLTGTLKKGILITGFNGGNTNGTTGDFSYGIEGFLVENGELVKPVSEMNIAGNMLVLWKELAAVANDPNPNSSWRIPSLLFSNVDFSGI